MAGKRKIEIVIVIAVVIIAVLLLGIKRNATSKAAKEGALMDQLKAVRMSVALYLEVNKAYPPNLKVLTTNSFMLGDKKVTYLTNVKADDQGNPIDAFGNQFSYDPATGKVVAVEKGYEGW